MPPPARRWTEAEDDEMRRLSAEGVGPRAIALELGRGETRVKQRRKLLGVARPKRRWSVEEGKRLAELRDCGMTLRRIASILGRSRLSVKRYAQTHPRVHERHPLDRREDDSQPPVAPLTVPAAWAGAMRAILAADDLRAVAEAYRRPARLLAAMIRHADMVVVEGEADAAGLLVPFLDRADRLERVARLG